MSAEDPRFFELDEFAIPEVGQWATTKHKKVAYYSSLFASGMKKKWDCRVYIDLFAGAGKCKIRDSGKILPGSPLLALNIEVPFEKYVFCEIDTVSITSLEARVKKYFPERNCSFIECDINDSIELLFEHIPEFSNKYTGLTLCFVDPYKASNLKFDTIKKIAENLYVDFLILIPSYMDINRNETNYVNHSNETLDLFLGSKTWRMIWKERNIFSTKFGDFIADQFGHQMKELNYLYEGAKDLELVRGTDRNIPLYHLAFFSRNIKGLQFWRETQKRTNKQLKFW